MRIRRRYWVIAATLLVTLLVAILGAVAAHVPFSSETLRDKVAAALSDRLDADVELEKLSFRMYPRFRVNGRKLAIHQKGRRDIPPLISMDAFTVDADLAGLWRKRISRLSVEGLAIQIPPKKDRQNRWEDTDASGRDYIVEELIANDSTLSIIPKNPEKSPRVWQMHELLLQQVGIGQKMPFKSVLTNAVPPGRITTGGTFGPWDVEDPGQTPLDGTFVFEDADLSVFKGISGILSAHGTYGGELERIDIKGETDTPDFMVKVSGHPVALKTKYHAIVDGTNGDTTLEQIDARFLKSSLVAKGGVYHKEGIRGRTVTLEITMDEARIEDMMRLAVKTERAPMTGGLTLRTKFELPPGDQDVVEKLLLDGRFTIADGRFTEPTVQQKIGELSRRASGNGGEEARRAPVDSDFTGRFRLGNGVLALPSVTFVVPSAAVQLAGRYGLQTETIAFSGNLYMDAKVSQTMTGWKSLLLKLVDPLFRKDGKTIVPIKIAGTRSVPKFGLDTSRVFKRGDPKPRPGPGPAPKTVGSAKAR